MTFRITFEPLGDIHKFLGSYYCLDRAQAEVEILDDLVAQIGVWSIRDYDTGTTRAKYIRGRWYVAPEGFELVPIGEPND